MSKGKNVPKEKTFLMETNNETTNGKDIPFNGFEYTFKSREDSIKKAGRTVILNKDLDNLRSAETNKDIRVRAGNTLKKLRKDYGLSRLELGELIGVSDKTIEHYENASSEKPDITTFIKCAEVFSSLPDKNGNYHRVSLDTLTGLTSFSSVDNELIHDQLGLDNEAIDALRELNESDRDIMADNAYWFSSKMALFMSPRLTPINYVLGSGKIKKLCDTFMSYIQPGIFEKLRAIVGDKIIDIPYEGSMLFTSSRNNVMTPLNLDVSYNKAVTKIKLDSILNELDNEYQTYLDNNDPIIKMIIDNRAMFKEYFEDGLTAADIKNEILEVLKQDPDFKNMVQNNLQAIRKKQN